jgi:hypothetical protein
MQAQAQAQASPQSRLRSPEQLPPGPQLHSDKEVRLVVFGIGG